MPRTVLRRLTRNFFLIPTLLFSGIFLVGCLSPFLNPAKWWGIGFLSLLQPYLICLLVLLFIFWLAAKPLYALIPLVSLLIGWKQFRSIFAFNGIASFNVEKKANNLRIVSWNVGNLNGTSKRKDALQHSRTEIANTILSMNPDIICLQEFNHSNTQGKQADNIGLFTEQYPYYYFSKDVNKRKGFYQAGSIIFSKFPIVDSARFEYPQGIKESFLYADVKIQNDTIRVFNAHLQSFRLGDSDYSNIEKITTDENVSVEDSKSTLNKMKLAFTRRGIQADFIREKTADCPYKSMICGDFNDVPGSYVYFTIRQKRKDAFLEKGLGIGRSFISLAPTLRIDYILPDQHFKVNQFEMIDEGLSDHIMLVTDLSVMDN
ncbi:MULTISPECIES: endonuclease/exonuclease/phosphatase family protein [Chitinophagaceae]